MLYYQRNVVSAALCGLLLGTSLSAAAATDSRNDNAGEPVLSVDRAGAQFRLQLGPQTLIRTGDQPIRDPRMILVPDAPSRFVLWEEDQPTGSQPYYAVSLDGERFSRPRPAVYDLRLRHGDFDPHRTIRTVDSGLVQSPASELHIVQFPVPPLEDFRTALRGLGATVHNYLPHCALLVRMDAQTRTAVEALPFIRWVGPYHPAYRLEPALATALADASLPASEARYRIQMIDAGPSEKQALLDGIAAVGGTVNVACEQSAFVQATLTPEQLLQVVQMDEVLFIDRQGTPVTLMDKARAIGGANYIETAGGYTGQGVRGEVMDNGCQTTHPAFASRLTVRLGGFGTESHGTSTFGINFGDGTGSPNGRGMLPSGNGVFSLWNTDNRVNDAAQLVSSTWQCLYQSNSWGTTDGSGYSFDYNSSSSELDQAVYLHDLLIVQGQGNYRYSGSLREAWAKNIVSVGGIHHLDTLTKSDDYWYSASIGPAADDRIKPDLCHFYDSIRTTTTGSGYTSNFGGTSGATPIVAGHFGLFYEMWADGLFGNLTGGQSVFEERPSSATARAVIINTASAYPFSGTGHNLTRTHQGWGLPDLQVLYDRRNNIRVVDETDILLPFQTTSYERTIVPGQPYHDQLRVTLVYTDYYGTTSSSLHRINDLSLRVTSPGGTVYYGNNGLRSGNWSTSGGSSNTIDVVENVFISSPAAGQWVIEVIADEINQDGRPETPGVLDADYALVITGGDEDCNNNGVADSIDIATGTSQDCNGNGIPDECDIDRGRSLDCNENGVPDECDLADGTSIDCNGNGIPDECDIAQGLASDCDGDLVPDECQPDCNGNGIADVCEILGGALTDANGNGVPDVCEVEPRLEAGFTTANHVVKTVTLQNTYTNPVVVCTGQYFFNGKRMIPRVSNVTSSSFDLRLADPTNPSQTYSIQEVVGYWVMEQGVTELSGVKMEAWKYTSTVTDGNGTWTGEPRRYWRQYDEPVVLGQVMSSNDAWSVFWTQGLQTEDAPSPYNLRTGKHTGSTGQNRVDETIGVIVFEGVTDASLAGVPFEAWVGPAAVKGLLHGTPPQTAYTLQTPMAAPQFVAIATGAGLKGNTGYWAQRHGQAGSGGSTYLLLSLDDDIARTHTTGEQVAYALLQNSMVWPRVPDFDGDGDVDLKDFGAFQVCFDQAAAGTCLPGDLNGDGYVDEEDVTPFLNHMQGPSS